MIYDNIIYGIMLIIWVISIGLIIDSIKKDKIKSNYMIAYSQLYNFVTGFFSYIIYFFSVIFFLKFSSNSRGFSSGELIIGVTFPIIIVLMFFIPINTKCYKKINISLIKYIILSICTALLGFGTFILLGELGIVG